MREMRGSNAVLMRKNFDLWHNIWSAIVSDIIIELVCKLPEKHRSIPFKNDFVNGDF